MGSDKPGGADVLRAGEGSQPVSLHSEESAYGFEAK